jgi:hypothetical protein
VLKHKVQIKVIVKITFRFSEGQAGGQLMIIGHLQARGAVMVHFDDKNSPPGLHLFIVLYFGT